MTRFLTPVKHQILVVEQSHDGRLFNRGKLLNIGFELASSRHGTSHLAAAVNYVFHDVDLLPSDSLRHFYIEPCTQPIHIAAAWGRYNKNPRYFGGIVVFNADDFRAVNGYPNTFWGWGGEDDELYARVRAAKLNVVKVSSQEGSVIDLEDLSLADKLTVLKASNTKFMRKQEALAEHRKTWKKNGICSLRYTLLGERQCPQAAAAAACVVVSVDVGLNKHWTDEFAVRGSGGAEMPTVTNAKDAIEIATAFTSASVSASASASASTPESLPQPPMPSQVRLPWSFAPDAVKRTLEYIFDYLGHKCYMLCVRDGQKHMVRLLPNEPEPTRRGIDAQVAKLEENRLLTPAQKAHIAEFVSAPVRVMQCIVKRYSAENTPIEYWSFLQDLDLPDGVTILNLTDAVILRHDRRHPFPMLLDEELPKPFREGGYLPILSISGQEGYDDIPIPNYDDLAYVQKGVDLSQKYVTAWGKKKLLAVFRGGPTGCGYTPETNARLAIAQLNHPKIDAQLTGKGATISNRGIRLDPQHGIGTINSAIRPTQTFLPLAKQSEYKIIIHVDGNVNAYRLLGTMLTGSLILRVKSPYRSWADHLLRAGTHYAEAAADLHDLGDRVQEFLDPRNAAVATEIARCGRQIAKKLLQYDTIKAYVERIFAHLEYRTAAR